MTQRYPWSTYQHGVVLWALCAKRMAPHPPSARTSVQKVIVMFAECSCSSPATTDNTLSRPSDDDKNVAPFPRLWVPVQTSSESQL